MLFEIGQVYKHVTEEVFVKIVEVKANGARVEVGINGHTLPLGHIQNFDEIYWRRTELTDIPLGPHQAEDVPDAF